jgi:hypothetical protein
MDKPCNEFCDARICAAIRQVSSATIPIAGHRQRRQVRWKSAIGDIARQQVAKRGAVIFFEPRLSS